MNKELNFRFIIDTMLESSFNLECSFVTVILPEEKAVNLNDFKRSLTACGLTKEPRSNKNEVGFSLQANSWIDGKCPFYQDINDFWTETRNSSTLPEIYFILKDKQSSIHDCDLSITCIKCYLEWKNVVSKIANYCVEKDYIIFIPNESGGKELVINISCSLQDVFSNTDSTACLENALEFVKVLSIDDAQSPERISIMKSALLDILSEDEQKNIVSILMKHAKFYKRYNELLDLYTKRFSVNKILSEIEQKNLEYTTRINEFISSSQNKAFAIPGALIAIGGLVKSPDFLTLLLIYIGLTMVYKITKMANDVHMESYDSITDDIDESFSRYYKFDEGAEVRGSAQKTMEILKSKIVKAKGRLVKINETGEWMLVIGAIYLLLRLFFK